MPTWFCEVPPVNCQGVAEEDRRSRVEVGQAAQRGVRIIKEPRDKSSSDNLRAAGLGSRPDMFKSISIRNGRRSAPLGSHERGRGTLLGETVVVPSTGAKNSAPSPCL